MHPRKRTDRVNDYFEILLYVLAAGCFVYFGLHDAGDKMFQSVLIVTVLIVLRLIVKRTKTELFPALRFSILFFIMLTMVIANQFGFYGVIPYLDKIEHFLSGIILCYVGLIIYKKTAKEDILQPTGRLAVWFALFFAAAMSGVWEIWEFSTDRLLGMNSQNGSLTDSMIDMILGDLGAAGAAVYLFHDAKRSLDVFSCEMKKSWEA